MSIKTEVATTRIWHEGRFNFNELLKLFFNVIVGEGYFIMGDTHAQKDKGAMEKAEIDWNFEKEVDDYTKFHIVVKMIINGITNVVIKKGDKEIKTNEANAYIKITGFVETDYNNDWEKNKFLESLRRFYERYLFKATRDSYEEEVYKTVNFIAGEVKAFLKQPRFE